MMLIQFAKENGETGAMTREQIIRLIWMKIREKLSIAKYDEEDIRAEREEAVFAITNATRGEGVTDYKLCTDAELQYVCDYITQPKRTLNKVLPVHAKALRATRNQVDKVRFVGLKCALYYADFTKFQYVYKDTGVILTGEELREFAKGHFYKNTIPSELSKFMFTSWINPKINDILEKTTKARYYFKHHEMSHHEANQVIKVLEKISVEIAERYESLRTISTLN
jgi:hypothetical protein